MSRAPRGGWLGSGIDWLGGDSLIHSGAGRLFLSVAHVVMFMVTVDDLKNYTPVCCRHTTYKYQC